MSDHLPSIIGDGEVVAAGSPCTTDVGFGERESEYCVLIHNPSDSIAVMVGEDVVSLNDRIEPGGTAGYRVSPEDRVFLQSLSDDPQTVHVMFMESSEFDAYLLSTKEGEKNE